jgi:hypothetical protein
MEICIFVHALDPSVSFVTQFEDAVPGVDGAPAAFLR